MSRFFRSKNAPKNEPHADQVPVRTRRATKSDARRAETRFRRLRLDQLEERTLLSVAQVPPPGANTTTDYNDRTSAETRHAIAVDGHGDQVVVWTAYDSSVKHDRIWVALYNPNGSLATNASGVAIQPFMVANSMATQTLQEVVNDNGANNIVTGVTKATNSDGTTSNYDQAWATVAMDKDGDFVVTWTQYDNVTVTNPATGSPEVISDTNIYARRFDSMGNALPILNSGSSGGTANGAVRLNTYTANNQKWSTVAMDVQGDFVVTWSSLGQEDNQQLGGGYGVYARRYNMAGAALGTEFQINETTGGSQMYSSVAMDSYGGFVVTWTSIAPGQNAHVYARDYDTNGNPKASPDLGEIEVDADTAGNPMAGNNEYSDVACTPDGSEFVVTWQSSANSSNANEGWDVEQAQFSRIVTALQNPIVVTSLDTPFQIGNPTPNETDPTTGLATHGQNVSTINVNATNTGNLFPNGFRVLNLTVGLTVTDPYDSYLTCWVESPQGTFVQLFSHVPLNPTTNPNNQTNFTGTTFNDSATQLIQSLASVAPFTGTYVPAQALTNFQGQEAFGNWRIWFSDSGDPDQPNQPIYNAQGQIIGFTLGNPHYLTTWSLSFTVSPVILYPVIVGSPTGNQEYPSIAMANDDSYSISWSGYGTNAITGAVVPNGVYYQRFTAAGTPAGFVNTPPNPNPGAPISPTTTSNTIVPGQTGDYTEVVPASVLSGTIYGIALTIEDLGATNLTPVNLTATLTSPSGTVITLFSPPNLVPGTSFNATTRGYFTNAVFDNTAKYDITNTVGDVSPGVPDSLPFSNTYRPQSGLFGSDSAGTWTFAVTNGNQVDSILIASWSLLQSPSLVSTESMAASAGLASIADDDNGNVALVWTDSGSSAPPAENNKVYKYTQDVAQTLDVGPMPVHIYTPNSSGNSLGQTPISNGGVIQFPSAGPNQLILTFDQALTTNDPTFFNDVTNAQNWVLMQNGTQLVGGVASVGFFTDSNGNPIVDPATRKYEALVTFDGNGQRTGEPPLPVGDYQLIATDLITGTNGNAIDGDLNGSPGTDPTNTPGTVSSSPATEGFAFNFIVNVVSGSTTTASGTTTTTASSTPAITAQLGAETLVNQSTTYYDETAPVFASNSSEGVPTQAVATDGSGDYAVVWTRIGGPNENQALDPNWQNDGDIYMRFFNRLNQPLTGDVLVDAPSLLAAGENPIGNQYDASVAMDLTGDFVVVWQSQRANDPGAPAALGSTAYYDIYGQRFNAEGQPVGINFQINTQTNTNSYHPVVAMDEFGDFTVAWATQGQPFSYYSDVHARQYDFNGNPLSADNYGGQEFAVNQGTNIPGIVTEATVGLGYEIDPTIAMDYKGDFVVAWDEGTAELNGVLVNSEVQFRLFNPIAVALTNDTVAEVGSAAFVSDPTHTNHYGSAAITATTQTEFTARNPHVAMDSAGNFIVAWESYQDDDYSPQGTPTSYGIYYRQFDYDPTSNAAGPFGVPQTAVDYNANQVITDTNPADGGPVALNNSLYFSGAQVNPGVAMDADGDYTITWDGNGAVPNAINPNDQAVSTVTQAETQGAWTRNFQAGEPQASDPQAASPPFLPAITTETRTNVTSTGSQMYNTVAEGPSGTTVEVWMGNGVDDTNGIYSRVYVDPNHTAGPQATAIYTVDANNNPVMRLGAGNALDVSSNTNKIAVVFDEQMSITGPSSVTNTGNYELVDSAGNILSGAITAATVFTNATGGMGVNPTTNQWQVTLTLSAALGNGNYTLRILAPTFNTNGGLPSVTGVRDVYGTGLNVTAFQQNGANTNLVIPIIVTTPANPIIGVDTPINSNPPPGGTAIEGLEPAVATAANGSYVVVWANPINHTNATALPAGSPAAFDFDIVAQRFNASGLPLGAEFVVNTTYNAGNQLDPAVAMDNAGAFVVVWDGAGPQTTNETTLSAGSHYSDIFAQAYDANGNALGVIQVNQNLTGLQIHPAVAMNPSTGAFVVSWTGYDSSNTANNNNGTGAIYARAYTATEQPKTSQEFQVSASSPYLRDLSDVAMDPAGDYVISYEADTSESSSWGVYARYFYANGTSTGEIRLNVNNDTRSTFANLSGTTLSAIYETGPRVAMASNGDFVATWANYVSAANGYDVFARRFAPGIVARDAQEFMVNTTTAYWQLMPDVGVAPNGDFTIVWTSYGQDNAAVGDTQIQDQSYGIYARMYLDNGSNFVNAQTGVAPLEFRVNATVIGNQIAPRVSRDTTSGNAVVVWVGPAPVNNVSALNPNTADVFARIIDPPLPLTKPVTTTTTTTSTTTTKPTTTTTTTTTTKPTTTTTTTTTKPTTTTTTTTTTTKPTTTTTTTTTTKPTTTTTTTKPVTTTTTTTVPVTTAKPVTTTTTTATKPVTTTTATKPVTTTTPITVPVSTAKPVTTTTTAAKPVTTTTTTATKVTVAVSPPPPAVSPKPPTTTTVATKVAGVVLNAVAVNKVLSL